MIIIFNRPGFENKHLIKSYIFLDEEKLIKFNSPPESPKIGLTKYYNIMRIPNNTIMLKLNEITISKKLRYQYPFNNSDNSVSAEYIKRTYYKVLHEGKIFFISNKYFL